MYFLDIFLVSYFQIERFLADWPGAVVILHLGGGNCCAMDGHGSACLPEPGAGLPNRKGQRRPPVCT